MHAVVGSERAYTAHADDDDHTGRGQLRSGVMVCVRRGYQLPYRRLVGFDWCVGVEGYNILLTWVMACKQYEITCPYEIKIEVNKHILYVITFKLFMSADFLKGLLDIS